MPESVEVIIGRHLSSSGGHCRTATPVANREVWRYAAALGEFDSVFLNGPRRSVNRKVQGSSPCLGATSVSSRPGAKFDNIVQGQARRARTYSRCTATGQQRRPLFTTSMRTQLNSTRTREPACTPLHAVQNRKVAMQLSGSDAASYLFFGRSAFHRTLMRDARPPCRCLAGAARRLDCLPFCSSCPTTLDARRHQKKQAPCNPHSRSRCPSRGSSKSPR